MSELFPIIEAEPLALAVLSDDEVMRRHIPEILRRDGFAVTGQAQPHADFAPEGLAPAPDVIVLTETVATAHRAWSTVRDIRRHQPTVRIIVIAPDASTHDVRRMTEAGADGLVLQRGIDATLPIAVRAALSDQMCVPRVANTVVEAPALSYREKEILSLAINGFSNAQIARRLFLAESTIKSHLSSAFRRLGVRSRREAAAFILGADEVLRRSILVIPQAQRPTL
jgi:DNA-binding NarL/FixJ family response regulator